MNLSRSAAALVAALVAAPGVAHAQAAARGRPTLSPEVRAMVAIDTDVVALTHVRVIDGTGAPARPDQTLIVRDGRIAASGRRPRAPRSRPVRACSTSPASR